MHSKDVLSPGEHFVEIRGVKLWYSVKGSGPVLLIQPGGAGWGGDATPYIESLKPLEKVRTIVYLEPRGIGRSQRLKKLTAYSIKEYVEDIEYLRKYFKIPQIAIAGHSHGGFVALKYALEYLKNVERLVLIDTTPYIFLGDYHSWLIKRPGYLESLVALKKIQKNKSLSADDKERATLQILLPIIHFYDFQKVSTQFDEFLKNMIVSAEPHHFFNKYEAIRYDVRELIHQITVPTLIISGSDDMPHILLGSKILHKRIKNSSLVIIEKCGHWPMIETPDVFFKSIFPFLTH